VNWAIVRGETLTGVTTMEIDAGLDTGDMLLRHELPIEPDDDAVTLGRKLAGIGAPLMLETLRGLESGSVTPVPQDHAQATLAPILKKEDGLIDWRLPARDVWNRVRGLVPWPGAYTTFRGAMLHVWKCGMRNAECGVGELRVEGRKLYAGCGDGAVELLEVQLEGKRRMSAADFANGARIQPGEKLGL
jgi:methionyl-tRNA formyltransferase